VRSEKVVGVLLVALCGSLAPFAQPVAVAAWPDSPRLTRLSVTSDGGEANGWEPALSTDGAFVAFTSNSTALGASPSRAQVFRKDLRTGQVEMVSLDPGLLLGDESSYQPAISADGRFVAFASAARNLVVGDSNGVTDIFLRDMLLRSTLRVSVADDGSQADGGSELPSISNDGNRVSFTSRAQNLTPDTVTWWRDPNVFVRDIRGDVLRKASINSYGNNEVYGFPQNSFLRASAGPNALSADGRFLVFRGSTLGGALASAPCTGTYEYVRPYRFDWDANVNAMAPAALSVPALETAQEFGCGAQPTISADGSAVAYRNQAGSISVLTAGWSESGPRTVAVPELNGSGSVLHDPVLSRDGAAVIASRTSAGDALNSFPLDKLAQTFAVTASTGEVEVLSLTPGGELSGPAADGQEWWQVSVPSDSGSIAFVSSAADLVSGDANSAVDVFLRAAGVQPPPMRVVEPAVPGRYVALGDSYASGEGSSPFMDGTDTKFNQCHRSTRAAAVLFAANPGTGLKPLDLRHVACSGGVLADLYQTNRSGESPQLDALTEDTEVVTISMGGNDLEFAPVLRECVRRGVLTRKLRTCERSLAKKAEANFLALDTPREDLFGYTPLQYAYASIRLRAPKAEILAVGYPRLFPDGGLFNPCWYVYNSDQIWANGVVDRGNEIIRHNAVSMRATFVDLADSFRGHSACDSDPYINRLRLDANGIKRWRIIKPEYHTSEESFHPNPAGQLVIARALQSAYAVARGSAT
jgi:lysophospholipase L1-like esterase